MPRVRANGTLLEVERFGNEDAPSVVLINGLGSQLVRWDEQLCAMLVERGLHVIRFDNRDVGLSEKIHGGPQPDVRAVIARGYLGLRQPVVPYTLEDMAMDTAGLLDALGIRSAHVVGVSMGGMIGQTMALTHGERVRSLSSLMSHTGDRDPLLSSPRGVRALLGPRPRNRQQAMEGYLRFSRLAGSPGFPRDEEQIRARAGRAYDRCFCPEGFVRQMAAIFASGGRASRLRMLRIPTLVLHGKDDPLIRPRGGVATARAIPDSTLRIVDGWGHDLPRGMWPLLIDTISAHAQRADLQRTGARQGRAG